jgi:lysophospholipase L1-like esterase
MQKYSDVVLDKQGKPIAGLTVTVTTYPGGQPATIYATDGGSAVASVKTDTTGRFSFYAADGHYTLTITGKGVVSQAITDITLNDPSNDVQPSPVAGPRLQVVATRGRMPINVEGAGASNYTRFESYLWVRIGPRPVNSLRVVYCNRSAIGGGENWTNANDFQLEGAVVWGNQPLPLTFGGLKNPLLGQGAPFVMADKLGLNLPANAQLQLRSAAVVSAGQKVPVGQPSSYQYGGYDSTSAASQVYSGSGMTLPSGGTNATYGFVPLAVIGVPDQRHAAALLWGDSITYGTGDAINGETTYGHVGWAERGLVGAAAGGTNIPFVNVSRSGDSTATWSSAAIGYQGTRWSLLEYVTHAIFAMGINDISAGRTLAQLQANVQVAWAAAKRMGVKVYQTTLTPKTTSTDSWATLANQTVSAGYGASEVRGQFNAWLPSQVVAGNIDGIIDLNSSVCDPTNTDKWAVNGTANYLTADGLHPSTAGHILMSGVLNGLASTWTV